MERLPNEIIEHIVHLVVDCEAIEDAHELLNFMLTCKSWYHRIKSNTQFHKGFLWHFHKSNVPPYSCLISELDCNYADIEDVIDVITELPFIKNIHNLQITMWSAYGPRHIPYDRVSAIQRILGLANIKSIDIYLDHPKPHLIKQGHITIVKDRTSRLCWNLVLKFFENFEDVRMFSSVYDQEVKASYQKN